MAAGETGGISIEALRAYALEARRASMSMALSAAQGHGMNIEQTPKGFNVPVKNTFIINSAHRTRPRSLSTAFHTLRTNFHVDGELFGF